MRQPRFRKRLEKEHIAEQILTKQIISLPLRGWPPLFHFWTGEKRERERTFFFFFCMHTDLAYVPRRADLSRFGRYLQIESTYLRRHKCSGKRPRDR